MKKLSRNRILAVLLMSFLLFSNYGVMGFADPGTPDIPATEGTPDIPATPGTPDTPATPGTPDTPATPGTPDTPATEGTPDTPATEGTPFIPGIPATPFIPGTPATPFIPGTPDVPAVMANATITEVETLVDADNNGNDIIDEKVVKYNGGTSGKTITDVIPGKNNDIDRGTSLFNMKDGNNQVNAYCNDINHTIVNGQNYNVENLSEDTPGNKDNRLRGVVINGYNNSKETIEEYRARLTQDSSLTANQINKISKDEAIAATQMALWKLDNPKKNFTSNDDVTILAQYLLKQSEAAPSKYDTEIIENDVKREIKIIDDKIQTTLNYSVLTNGNEEILSTFFKVFIGENADTELVKGTDFEVVDGGEGSKNLILKNTISSLIAASAIKTTVEISGTYQVKDVYDLVPVTGNSQRLVSSPMLMSYNLPTLRQVFRIDYNPEIPVVPGTPDTPATEGTPDTPATEGTPDTPAIPGTPFIPGTQGTPFIPGTPGTPFIPGTPGTPFIPGTPGTPFIPGTPATPDPQPQNNGGRDNRGNTENIVDEVTPLAPPVLTQLAVVTPVEPTVEVIEEEVPLAVPVIETAVVVEQPVIDVAEENVPKGAPELPKTGGFAPELLYAVSLSLIGLGFKLKK